jgi:hypothetical protein
VRPNTSPGTAQVHTDPRQRLQHTGNGQRWRGHATCDVPGKAPTQPCTRPCPCLPLQAAQHSSTAHTHVASGGHEHTLPRSQATRPARSRRRAARLLRASPLRRTTAPPMYWGTHFRQRCQMSARHRQPVVAAACQTYLYIPRFHPWWDSARIYAYIARRGPALLPAIHVAEVDGMSRCPCHKHGNPPPPHDTAHSANRANAPPCNSSTPHRALRRDHCVQGNIITGIHPPS